MTLDHLSKLLVGLETLPLEGIAPVDEEPSSPPFRLVVSELPKRLLEDVGRVQPFIGLQQHLQAPVSPSRDPRITEGALYR